MQPERVRVAVVGTGGIGKYHLRLWGEMTDVETVGVHDVNASAARAAAEQFGVARAYETLAEAVEDKNVDIIDVCTPNVFHREGAVAALNAGKHCLCEKPLAVTAEDIQAMIRARDASGKMLATIQHFRFEQRTQILKRIIDAGRLGQVYYSRAWWLRRRAAPATPGFLSRAHAGRGPGADLGVHMLDLVMFLLEFPEPVAVTGHAGRMLADQPDIANEWGTFNAKDFEVEDFAVGMVRFADGSMLSLEVSWLLNMIEKEKWHVWLHGTEAGAGWPEIQLAHVRDGVLLDSTVASKMEQNGHKNEMRLFVDAIRDGGPSPVPAEQSLTVTRTLEALYESAETGREVRLD